MQGLSISNQNDLLLAYNHYQLSFFFNLFITEYKKGEKEEVRRMFLKVGDSIRWLWSVPIWLRSTDFHVFQIENLFSGIPVENGFKSGNKSNNGINNLLIVMRRKYVVINQSYFLFLIF